MLASRAERYGSPSVVLDVSSQVRLAASVVAVVVLGAVFGAFLLDGLKAPAEVPPAGHAAPAGAVDPCASVDQAVVPRQTTRFAAKTAADVVAWAPKDPYVRHSLEDMASVRPGPVYDPRVPKCRVDLLVLGAPAFVRAYPNSWGSWLVPVSIGGTVIATLSIGVASDGTGAVESIRGGASPTLAEADARVAGGTAADPVMAAELVYAAPFGCAPRDTVSWRLVRRSGTVVYVLADYPGAPPPGAVFREDEMRFMTTSRVPSKVGELATAC